MAKRSVHAGYLRDLCSCAVWDGSHDLALLAASCTITTHTAREITEKNRL